MGDDTEKPSSIFSGSRSASIAPTTKPQPWPSKLFKKKRDHSPGTTAQGRASSPRNSSNNRHSPTASQSFVPTHFPDLPRRPITDIPSSDGECYERLLEMQTLNISSQQDQPWAVQKPGFLDSGKHQKQQQQNDSIPQPVAVQIDNPLRPGSYEHPREAPRPQSRDGTATAVAVAVANNRKSSGHGNGNGNGNGSGNNTNNSRGYWKPPPGKSCRNWLGPLPPPLVLTVAEPNFPPPHPLSEAALAEYNRESVYLDEHVVFPGVQQRQQGKQEQRRPRQRRPPPAPAPAAAAPHDGNLATSKGDPRGGRATTDSGTRSRDCQICHRADSAAPGPGGRRLCADCERIFNPARNGVFAATAAGWRPGRGEEEARAAPPLRTAREIKIVPSARSPRKIDVGRPTKTGTAAGGENDEDEDEDSSSICTSLWWQSPLVKEGRRGAVVVSLGGEDNAKGNSDGRDWGSPADVAQLLRKATGQEGCRRVVDGTAGGGGDDNDSRKFRISEVRALTPEVVPTPTEEGPVDGRVPEEEGVPEWTDEWEGWSYYLGLEDSSPAAEDDAGSDHSEELEGSPEGASSTVGDDSSTTGSTRTVTAAAADKKPIDRMAILEAMRIDFERQERRRKAAQWVGAIALRRPWERDGDGDGGEGYASSVHDDSDEDDDNGGDDDYDARSETTGGLSSMVAELRQYKSFVEILGTVTEHDVYDGVSGHRFAKTPVYDEDQPPSPIMFL